jgi:hypothetical protein
MHWSRSRRAHCAVVGGDDVGVGEDAVRGIRVDAGEGGCYLLRVRAGDRAKEQKGQGQVDDKQMERAGDFASLKGPQRQQFSVAVNRSLKIHPSVCQAQGANVNRGN